MSLYLAMPLSRVFVSSLSRLLCLLSHPASSSLLSLSLSLSSPLAAASFFGGVLAVVSPNSLSHTVANASSLSLSLSATSPRRRVENLISHRNEKHLAISTALSSVATAANVLVVEDFGEQFAAGLKTKEFIAAMKRWGLDPKEKALFLMTVCLRTTDPLSTISMTCTASS